MRVSIVRQQHTERTSSGGSLGVGLLDSCGCVLEAEKRYVDYMDLVCGQVFFS